MRQRELSTDQKGREKDNNHHCKLDGVPDVFYLIPCIAHPYSIGTFCVLSRDSLVVQFDYENPHNLRITLPFNVTVPPQEGGTVW